MTRRSENPSTRTVHPTRALAALAFAGLCAAYMQTILVPIQGRLPELLDAPLAVTGWAMTIMQMAAAVSMPVTGRLGDMYGKRRVALFLIGALVLGSVVAASADHIAVLIAGRFLQGIGFGVIVVGISLLREVMPPERLGTAVALLSAMLGAGSALGTPVSAFVAERYDWHVLFWVSAALCALAGTLVWAWVPPSTVKSGGRVDARGLIGLVLIVAAVLFLISNGAAVTPLARWGIGLGVVLLGALWVRHELSAPRPLVNLRVNASRAVVMTNLTALAMGFSLFVPLLVFPQKLELPAAFGGLSMTQLTVSLLLVPMGLAMVLMSPLVGQLERRWGAKRLVFSGALLLALGYALTLSFPPSVFLVLLAGVIIGAGTGLGFAAMPALIMAIVPPQETGSANGLNALGRTLGTAIAAAVTAGVLGNALVTIDGVTAPAQEGFNTVFVIALGASVLCAVLSALIPTPPRLGAAQRPALSAV